MVFGPKMVNRLVHWPTGSTARVSVDQLLFLGQGPVEKCKKHSHSSSSFSFLIERFTFPFESNGHLPRMLQWLVNRSTPISTNQGCFLVFWLSRLETYKVRAPLHLWERENLYLFVHLLVIAIKALILFLVY